jgi:hypothetical protein
MARAYAYVALPKVLQVAPGRHWGQLSSGKSQCYT